MYVYVYESARSLEGLARNLATGLARNLATGLARNLATGFPDVASNHSRGRCISKQGEGAPPARSVVETSNFLTSRPSAGHATGFPDVASGRPRDGISRRRLRAKLDRSNFQRERRGSADPVRGGDFEFPDLATAGQPRDGISRRRLRAKLGRSNLQ